MRRFSRLMAAVAVLATAACAQAPSQLPQAPTPQANARRVDSPAQAPQIEVVDVAAQDKGGHPVRGLKPTGFRVSEDNVQQTILHMQEHSSLAPARQGAELPKMPPGTFTDYMPVPADGTLNVLVLDALNTPAKNQNFMRNELEEYVKQAAPHTRIAIFGLANRLILLQGFTSDPGTLRSVLEHKLIPRTPLQSRTDGSGADAKNTQEEMEDNAPSMAELAANLQEFQAETGAMETQLRTQFTLDAFNTLGHYLAALPGRKNVIWFSGSFPLNLSAQQPQQSASGDVQVDQEELRGAANLLNEARAAIYPVEAAGSTAESKHSGEHNGGGSADEAATPSGKLKKSQVAQQAADRATMDALANGSGGRAFDEVDNLADAVSKAVDAGANYYTLMYSPGNEQEDGSYRAIRVDLAGAASQPGVRLFYRHGYFAGSGNATAASLKAADAAYDREAMSRGAPTPVDLMFKVRVLPATNATDTSLAPDNVLDPSVSAKGPFRRYSVDFLAFPRELTLTLGPDGRHTGQVDFLAYVFDVDGRLLNATGKSYKLDLTPDTYARLMRGAIECHLDVSVPAGVETFLRMGVRDVPKNHFGVIEVPTANVSHLNPLNPAATPAPAAPKPSGPPPS